jgi:membrane protein
VVWINYFSRIVMYAAAWAYTSRLSQEARADAATTPEPSVVPTRTVSVPTVAADTSRTGADPRLAFGAGAATALGLVALARRRRR